jgi:hypothetical protein
MTREEEETWLWQLRKTKFEREDCRSAQEQLLYSRAIRSLGGLLAREKERREGDAKREGFSVE